MRSAGGEGLGVTRPRLRGMDPSETRLFAPQGSLFLFLLCPRLRADPAPPFSTARGFFGSPAPPLPSPSALRCAPARWARERSGAKRERSSLPPPSSLPCARCCFRCQMLCKKKKENNIFLKKKQAMQCKGRWKRAIALCIASFLPFWVAKNEAQLPWPKGRGRWAM